jgi:hypothetical protein
MRLPLAAPLIALLSLPAAAQISAEAGSAALGAESGASARSVGAVPGVISAAALTPSLAAPSANLSGAPSVVLAAPAPSASAPLPASALIAIDPKSLPDSGKHYTPTEWGKLVAATPGGGAKAILNSMSNSPISSPELHVTLADGEQVEGRFQGLNGDKMIFESGGKLVGLDRGNLDVTKVSRLVDVNFDGAELRPAEVVVHDRPAVADPFKDLAAYKGRVVDMDIHDLDDPKWSRQTVSGRVVKADGESVELEGPKGTTHVQREFHQIDSVALRTEHYSSRGQISSITDVNGKVPLGAPVELALAGGKSASGLFRGVRKDASGLFVVVETPNGGFRGYRDFADLRTPGYASGALLPGAEPVYARPQK